MRKYTRKQKIATALGAGAIAVAGAGTAFAFWTSTGAGSGSATAAATGGTLTLTASATNLVPGGGTAGVYTIPVYAANTNPTSLAISHINESAFTAGAACDAVSGATAVANDPVSQVVVAAGASNVQVGTISLTFPDSTTVDQSACKSANWTFTLGAS